MQIQSEIIYPESIMAHSYFLRILYPVFHKNRAKGMLCVCSGVLCISEFALDDSHLRKRKRKQQRWWMSELFLPEGSIQHSLGGAKKFLFTFDVFLKWKGQRG